jgi:hypothetical protein
MKQHVVLESQKAIEDLELGYIIKMQQRELLKKILFNIVWKQQIQYSKS